MCKGRNHDKLGGNKPQCHIITISQSVPRIQMYSNKHIQQNICATDVIVRTQVTQFTLENKPHKVLYIY